MCVQWCRGSGYRITRCATEQQQQLLRLRLGMRLAPFAGFALSSTLTHTVVGRRTKVKSLTTRSRALLVRLHSEDYLLLQAGARGGQGSSNRVHASTDSSLSSHSSEPVPMGSFTIRWSLICFVAPLLFYKPSP